MKRRSTAHNTVYAAILRGTSSRIMAVDNDLKIVYVNEAASDFLRGAESGIQQQIPVFKVDELIGTSIDIFHAHPMRQRDLLARIEHPYLTSIKISGTVFNLYAFPLFDDHGKRIGSAVEWLDPREMDHAGQVAAIQRSQAVIEFTLEGEIISANSNFLAVMGYELCEVQGRHHRMFVDQDYAASREYELFWERLRSGDFFSSQYTRVGKDGRNVVIQGSYNPILDLNGRPFKIVKYASDITSSTQMQKESNQLKELIEQRLNHVASAIMDANAKGALQQSYNTSANVQTIAAAIEEMNVSIGEISQNMSRTEQVITKTQQETQQVTKASEGLVNEALVMSDVVSFIQQIASQINLLALNATIESSRAGEAGRGFAVVAGEVKQLANQTAIATADITEKIAAMQATAQLVTAGINVIRQAVMDVSDYMGGVASAIHEQSAVTQEIARNMEIAATLTTSVGESVRKVVEVNEMLDMAMVEIRDASRTGLPVQ